MKISPFLPSIFFLALSSTYASTYTVDYSLNLGAGTLNGNPITNILILETDGNQVSFDSSFNGPTSGLFSLIHDVPFLPVYSLIIGLDLPSTAAGDNKTHLVLFTNDAFAQSANGVLFSTAFAHTRHNDFITRLLSAEGGDTAQVDWIKTFFASGDGLAAAFATGSGSTAIEFSGGVVLAIPEPVSMGLVALGGVLILAARRRR